MVEPNGVEPLTSTLPVLPRAKIIQHTVVYTVVLVDLSTI